MQEGYLWYELIDGVKGEKGDKGDKGDPGDPGAPGAKGNDGAPGAKGDKGDTGNQGLQGVQGNPGNDGAAGAKGDKGDTGNQGIQGNPGAKGDTGDQGIQGIQGVPGTSNFCINVQALTSSPADSATIYFGTLPKVPVSTGGQSKIYIRQACTLKKVEIYCYSGTAGTAEAWSLYVRKNNTTDTLIATLSVSVSERIFTNAGLNIALVSGDYIEIKAVNPLWATNPLTTIFGGYLYFE